MADKLAKLADLKSLLGLSGTGHDTLLTQLLESATSLAESAGLAGRPLLRQADRVEYPEVHHDRATRLRLDLAPIESVSEVVVLYVASSDADFDAEVAAGGALVAEEDYFVDTTAGTLIRANAWWPCGPRTTRVTYTGGYIDPDEAAPPAGSLQPPRSLQHGLIMQAAAWFNAGAKAGLKNTGGGAGGKSDQVELASPEAHPQLVEACRALRRITV